MKHLSFIITLSALLSGTAPAGLTSSAFACQGCTLSGTFGQTDAIAPFTGGFWSFLTVLSVPDAPELTLRFTSAGTRAVLSWDVNTTGWRVEMSTDLHTWTAVPAAVTNTMSHHTITLPAVQRAYFRLTR